MTATERQWVGKSYFILELSARASYLNRQGFLKFKKSALTLNLLKCYGNYGNHITYKKDITNNLK